MVATTARYLRILWIDDANTSNRQTSSRHSQYFSSLGIDGGLQQSHGRAPCHYDADGIHHVGHLDCSVWRNGFSLCAGRLVDWGNMHRVFYGISDMALCATRILAH